MLMGHYLFYDPWLIYERHNTWSRLFTTHVSLKMFRVDPTSIGREIYSYRLTYNILTLTDTIIRTSSHKVAYISTWTVTGILKLDQQMMEWRGDNSSALVFFYWISSNDPGFMRYFWICCVLRAESTTVLNLIRTTCPGRSFGGSEWILRPSSPSPLWSKELPRMGAEYRQICFRW